MGRCSNLIGEIAKRGIQNKEIAKELGVHINTLGNKLNGESPFTIGEAFAIKEKFFPDSNLDYLFATENKPAC